MSKSHTLHQRALASALMVVLSTGFAGAAAAAGRVDTSGLRSPDQTTFDRFIVK